MKIRPVGAELFHAGGWKDGPTDMKKLIVAFRSFADAPKTLRFGCLCVAYVYDSEARLLL